MPVSPQDFALWSNLTGNPYPQTPAERMALAPQVYEFNRNLGRSGGPIMSPARRAVDVVGKAALAAGALAGAAYLGSKYLGGGDDDGGGGFPASFGKLGLDDESGVPPVGPMGGGGPGSQVVEASRDITPPTTSDRYGQDVISNQTSLVQAAKGLSSFKPTTSPIEQKPATQSEVIGSQQHFSPGTEEEMLGQGAAEKAAAFRKSRAYAVMQKQYPGLRETDDELVGAPGASEAPVVITETVKPSPVVRVSKPAVVVEESPIVEMARPVAAPVTVGGGPSAEEIREIDTSLARGLARHTPEQRVEIRNQMLAKKYGSAPAPAEVETIVTTTQPIPLRVVSEPAQKSTKVKVNEFLSKMSQGEGPLESYEIPAARSSAVRGVNLYPGGEIGVVLPTKQGSKEYAYGATDPMRLAVGDYAAEGFPSEMGHLGKIFGYQGIGPGMGLMQGLSEGGKASTSSAPLYTGLMSKSEISSAMDAPKRTVTARRLAERAANDQETRAIMEHLERRASERRALA